MRIGSDYLWAEGQRFSELCGVLCCVLCRDKKQKSLAVPEGRASVEIDPC